MMLKYKDLDRSGPVEPDPPFIGNLVELLREDVNYAGEFLAAWAHKDVPGELRYTKEPENNGGMLNHFQGLERLANGFLALSGFVLVFSAGYEYFFWTGLLLALFCAVALCLAHWPGQGGLAPDRVSQQRRSMALAYSAFYLVFMLIHGASSRLGVILELYTAEAVNQYEWPAGRVWLMLVGAAALLVVTLVSMQKMLRHPHIAPYPDTSARRLPVRIADLFTATGIVGAISIWPAKIGVLYAVCICLALFAFNRINCRLDDIDRASVAPSAMDTPV